jgi:hypothetical protein
VRRKLIPRARFRRMLGALCVASVLIASPTGAEAGSVSHRPAGRVHVETKRFEFGMTHTQHSADGWGDPVAVKSATAIATALGGLQDQAIMGWGVGNPEPRPGIFDFTSLDRRIRFIRSTGATPVITLCGAPDWMKGGTPGVTDWSNINVAPTTPHFDDFAKLASAVARRYPDVVHFMVWNELKGFYDRARNRWDYERYTALYNKVYDALKAVNPSIRVGGPYAVIDSWSSRAVASNPAEVQGPWGVLDQRSLDVVDYWLAHAHGADFLAVDAAATPRDAPQAVDPRVAVQKFAAVDRWLRQRTNLPIWWAEFYVQPAGIMWSPARQSAMVMRALRSMRASGAEAALLWQPEAAPEGNPRGLWTSTAVRGGGRPLPLATAIKAAFGGKHQGHAASTHTH